jgi:hypothetical protein
MAPDSICATPHKLFAVLQRLRARILRSCTGFSRARVLATYCPDESAARSSLLFSAADLEECNKSSKSAFGTGRL